MLPKQSEIELPLLKCLEEMGGRGKPKDIYPRLLKFFPDITDSDLTVAVRSGVNKWKNSIAWVRQKLVAQGEMESLARGVWAITPKGKNRLASPELPKKKGAGQSFVSTLRSVQDLFPAASKPVQSDARSRRVSAAKAEEEFENSVWHLIFSLSPSAITIGRDPQISLPGAKFRPDVVALFEEDRVLIAECKLTTHDAYISNWISEFRSVKRDLEETLRKSGCNQFAYALFVQDKTALSHRLQQEAEQLRVRLLDRREVDYLRTVHEHSGIGISHMFWARIAPSILRNGRDDRLPALRVRTGGRSEVYIFSVNAHDLLTRSFVSHRQLHSPEEGHIGFQRMFQKKKLNEIARYIERYKVFPTPIVVAFSKSAPPIFEPMPMARRAAERMRQVIEFGHIRLPRRPDTVQIIDGQHRLYGYSKLRRSDDHVVHVIGYRAVPATSLATMFVDINSKQTKVPSNLLWELYPDIYGNDDPEYPRAVISRVMESTAKRHLEGYVHHISTGMRGDISFQTLCTEIKRTRLLEELGGEDALKAVVDAFFSALKLLGERYPSVNVSLVFSNNGMSPMIRTMGRVIRYEIGQNRRDNLKRRHLLCDTFHSFFEPVYKHFCELGENALRNIRKRTGNVGMIQTEDEITDAIRAAYKHDFPYRPKKTPPEWANTLDRCASLMVTINQEVVDRGRAKDWVFRNFDAEKFKKHLDRPIDSYESFGHVLTTLYKEIFEGSGKDAPDNRLKQLLNIPRIHDLEPIAKLNILRNYWEHKREQLDAHKRQQAVRALADLCGKECLGGPSELDKTDYQNMAVALVRRFNDSVLGPTLTAISSPQTLLDAG